MTVIKSAEEVTIMRKAGKVVAAVLERLKKDMFYGVEMNRLDFSA